MTHTLVSVQIMVETDGSNEGSLQKRLLLKVPKIEFPDHGPKIQFLKLGWLYNELKMWQINCTNQIIVNPVLSWHQFEYFFSHVC